MIESADTYVEYDCGGAVGDSIVTSTLDWDIEDWALTFCGIETYGIKIYEDYSAELCEKKALEAGLTLGQPF